MQAAHRKAGSSTAISSRTTSSSLGARAADFVKLLDFGIAKLLDWTELAADLGAQATNTGAIVGTPQYMAFEQAMSEKDIDGRADIWSLGVIFFEALSGRRPIAFETLGQMYQAFLQGAVPSVREVLPGLPAEVAQVLDRCLAVDRRERLDDLEPFIAVLAPYAEAGPGATAGGRMRALAVRSPRGARARRALAAGLLLAAGVAGGVVALRSHRAGAPLTGALTAPDHAPESAAATREEPQPGRKDLPAPPPGPAGPAAAPTESSGGIRVRAGASVAAVTGTVPEGRPASSTSARPQAVPPALPSTSLRDPMPRDPVKKGILETPPY